MRILKKIRETIPNACKFRKNLSETGEGFTLQRSRAYWREYTKGMSILKWKETLAVGFMLLAGINVSSMIAKLAKKIGFVRKYG